MHKNIPLTDHELDLLARNDIRYVPYDHAEYPQSLRETYCPPPALYVKGARLDSLPKMIAVVGSRKADAYGRQRIDEIVPTLIGNQWSIVSGGAIGADTMAHQTTLKAGGITVAVFGSGLLVPYPAQNKKLFSSIIEKGGALVSPFPVTMPPLPHNFPARNRIISGISRGVIVIQAAQQSGASITATFALDQGREVFAIPGPVDSPLSKGCHRLIQQGAKLVQQATDILEEFGEVVTIASVPREVREPASIDEHILALCKFPISPSDLADTLKIDQSELYSRLFNLQIEGKISQNAAGLFELSVSF